MARLEAERVELRTAAENATREAEKHRSVAKLSIEARLHAEETARKAKEEADRDFGSHSKLNAAALKEAREKIHPDFHKCVIPGAWEGQTRCPSFTMSRQFVKELVVRIVCNKGFADQYAIKDLLIMSLSTKNM